MRRSIGRFFRPQQFVLIRVSQGDKVLFEEEVAPGSTIEQELPDDLRLDVLWIRTHRPNDPAARR